MSQFGISALAGASSGSFSKISDQFFITDGVYTPTSGMKYCIVEVVGGGGGGGGVGGGASFAAAGSGGGAGAYARGLFTAAQIASAQQVVVIGLGGNAGSSSGTVQPTAGQMSSLGSLISSVGGSPGVSVTASTVVGSTAGGVGGQNGFVPDQYTAPGGAGGNGLWTSTFAMSGYGGAGGLGGTSQYVTLTVSTNQSGYIGDTFGGGGSGAAQFQATFGSPGAFGQQGYIYIIEYS